MKMKARLTAIAVAWLIAGIPTAQAANSTEMTVTGVITPSACTPRLSPDGIVEYGKIPFSELKPDRPTELAVVTLEMSINCDAKTLYALMPHDNRPEGQNYTPNAFGLKKSSIGEPVGAYWVDVSGPPLADGVPVNRLFTLNNGATWRSYDVRDPWKPDILSAFGHSAGSSTTPLLIKDLVLSLDISTIIYQTRNLPATEDTPIDGSATFEMIYL